MEQFIIDFLPERKDQKVLRQKAVKFLEELVENDLVVNFSVNYETIRKSKIMEIAEKHGLPFVESSETLPNTNK